MTALLLACMILFVGCTPAEKESVSSVIETVLETVEIQPETTESTIETTDLVVESTAETTAPAVIVNQEETPTFTDLSDPELLYYIEDSVYADLVGELNSTEYFVENIDTVYISKEYLEEVAYNSQENIYFGYTLSELDAYFQGTRYVFALDENGQTIVQEFQEYDDTYEQVLKNVAIGTGVILVCVTVSVVTGGVGAPAVSLIFATSAKAGAIAALTDGVISGVSAGVVTGIQTKDFDAALKSAALNASEGFKWGAIAGTITGGLAETFALKGATMNNLTMNEAALIQKESKLPLDFIKNFHSVDEYTIYKNSGLQLTKINGKWSYIQDIDWDFIGDLEDGRTNAQRVLDGLAPLDSTGKSYELHHIGQQADSPLAILTNAQHHGNYGTLHANTGGSASNIDRTAFNTEKRNFWKALLEMTQGVN